MPLLLALVLLVVLLMVRRTDVAQLALGAKVLNPERAAGVHPVVFGALSEWSIRGPFPVRVTSGVRTDAEQQALYAQGRTAPGPIVTNASSATSSAHGYGAALDLIPLSAAGEEASELYPAMGEWFEARGFTWGGRWVSLYDPRHVELKNFRSLPFPPAY